MQQTTEKQALHYSFKVWLTAAIVAPSFVILNGYMHGISADMESYFTMTLFLLIMAIPSACILFLAVFNFGKYVASNINQKLVFSLVGGVIAFILLLIISLKHFQFNFDLPLYGSVIGSIWLYAIKPDETQTAPEPDEEPDYKF
jgi:hypothetical protein